MEIRRDCVDLADGRRAYVHVIDAAPYLRVTLCDLGATLLRIEAPDRLGRMGDVLLGSSNPALYPSAGAPSPHHYLGATCGRFANRIGGARLVLDGVEHRLSANEPPNHLHGGESGFDRALWRPEPMEGGVRLRHRSLAGDQGYPGTLEVSGDFLVTGPGELTIRYEAETDAPTHVNIVSHGYFNLSGVHSRSVLDHELFIAADHYLPIDPLALPHGSAAPVAGTAFDFNTPRKLRERIDSPDQQLVRGDGYNHCFVLRRLGHGVEAAARLRDPGSGRTMTVLTEQPGLQLYTGNALDGSFAPAPGLPGYRRRSGLCLEAQHFPDSPNRPEYPSTRLDPGETYRSETRLKFGIG